MSFQYGIMAAEADVNIKDVDKHYVTTQTVHQEYQDLWIQSGANAGQGLNIHIDEMNTTVLGLSGLKMTSHRTAGDAIAKCDGAIRAVSEVRGHLGAKYMP